MCTAFIGYNQGSTTSKSMLNCIERPDDWCRMDDLIGDAFKVLAFHDLPISHQRAIAHYLSVDCDAWQCFYAQEQALLHAYVREYGEELFGVIDLPAQRLVDSVMADPELETSHSGWEDYADWYCAAGDVPAYGPDNRWPVILSQDNDETLRDGWHRFHSYMRSGFSDIPAVFFPEKRHPNQVPQTS